MRVGIVRCMSRSRNCPSTACFRAINEKEGQFAQYDDIELVGVTTCGGCPVDDTTSILEAVELLLNRGAETIHLSTCLVGHCPFVDQLKAGVNEAHSDLTLEMGTHSGNYHWLKIKDQYPRVIS